MNVSSDADLERAFAALAPRSIDAVAVTAGPLLNSLRHKICATLERLAIPAISEVREFAAAGLLMSYGPDIADAYRWVGIYAGRILKGEKPADIPVIQPSKFQMVFNLRTAKAFGFEVPPMLLARADEVIE